MRLLQYILAMQDICFGLQDIDYVAGDDVIQSEHLLAEFVKSLTPEQEVVRAQLARIPRYVMIRHAVTILSLSIGMKADNKSQTDEASQMLVTLMQWAKEMEDKAKEEKPVN